MALFNSKELYKRWGIRTFPVGLKQEFKVLCKQDKKEMNSVLRSLVRDYVEETKELYIEKKIVSLPQSKHANGERGQFQVNFPVKLKADFKSCCASRGDKVVDAVVYLIEKYVGEKKNA